MLRRKSMNGKRLSLWQEICNLTSAKLRLKVEVVMPRKRVASIVYREICGDNFRDLLSDLSSDRPIDVPALELYADLWERIVPQQRG